MDYKNYRKRIKNKSATDIFNQKSISSSIVKNKEDDITKKQVNTKNVFEEKNKKDIESFDLKNEKDKEENIESSSFEKPIKNDNEENIDNIIKDEFDFSSIDINDDSDDNAGRKVKSSITKNNKKDKKEKKRKKTSLINKISKFDKGKSQNKWIKRNDNAEIIEDESFYKIEDSCVILSKQKAILIKALFEMNNDDSNQRHYLRDLISYIEENDFWIEDELLNIDEEAIDLCEELLKPQDNARGIHKSEKLYSIARRVLDENTYPRLLKDPTDKEIHGSKETHWFNVEKTLLRANLMWITKLIPLKILEKLFSNRHSTNFYAQNIQYAGAKKYNSFSKKEQMVSDLLKIIIKFTTTFIVATMIIVYIFAYSKPRMIYKDSISKFNSGSYTEAFLGFNKITNYKNANVLAGLSFGRSLTEDKKFKKAEDIFKKLESTKGELPSGVTIAMEMMENKYQEALYLYSENKYQKSSDIFEKIIDYKDSKKYYDKINYYLADKDFENGNKYEAMVRFNQIKKYKDANERSKNIAESFYLDAFDLYNKKEYKKAAKEFEKLNKVNYKESSNMVYQCSYKEALNSLNDGKFTESIKEFDKNITFKDSNSLISEARYRLGKNLFEHDPVKSIAEFEKIEGYKDANKYLLSPKIALFGRWKVDKINDTKVNNTTIDFNEDYSINSNKELLNLAKANEKYEFKDNKFILGDMKLELKIEDFNNIYLSAINGNKKTVYKLERLLTLRELLVDKNKTKEVLGEESTDTKVDRLIKTFIEMKVGKNDDESKLEKEIKNKNEKEKNKVGDS